MITPVATSNAAFLGRARRGPTDEPVTIYSFAEFGRLFGSLWSSSALGFALRDFFHNGGRPYRTSAGVATTTPTDVDRGAVNIEVGFAPLKPAEFVVIRVQQRARQS